jgi:hypothetical protein
MNNTRGFIRIGAPIGQHTTRAEVRRELAALYPDRTFKSTPAADGDVLLEWSLKNTIGARLLQRIAAAVDGAVVTLSKF